MLLFALLLLSVCLTHVVLASSCLCVNGKLSYVKAISGIISIYIYIYRERERDIDRERER